MRGSTVYLACMSVDYNNIEKTELQALIKQFMSFYHAGLIEPVQTGLLAGSLAGIFSILFTAHITGMIAVTCYLGIRSFLTKRRAQKNTSLKPAGGVFNLHNIIKKDKRKRSSQYSFYTAV